MSAKKSIKPSAFYTFKNPHVCRSADPHFTGGLILSVFVLGITKAIDKEKLPQLGYTTGRNSYWLANIARLLDAILTPGQHIERDLTYRRSCDRENDLLPILQNVTVTDTHHTRH